MEEKEVGLVVTYTRNNKQEGTIFYKDGTYEETSLEKAAYVIADIMLKDNIEKIENCNKQKVITYEDYKNNFNKYLEIANDLINQKNDNFKFAKIFEQVMNYYNN